MMTSTENAPEGKAQHAVPCHDCPMRVDALPGWLGGATPEEYRRLCHSDVPVACHAIRKTQCAGVAIYRTNVAQWAAWRLPADRAKVFSTPFQFLEWHSNIEASFEKLAKRK